MDDSAQIIIAGILALVPFSMIIFAIWHNRTISSDEERIRFANEHRRELERNRKQVEELKHKALEEPDDEEQELHHVIDDKATHNTFSFWWPTSQDAGTSMVWLLIAIGFLLFIKGCYDENLEGQLDSKYGHPYETFFIILFTYSFFGVVGWYFIINTGRFVLHSNKRRIETKPERDETQREIDELEALRRRAEIKRLKKELGEDNNNDKNDT